MSEEVVQGSNLLFYVLLVGVLSGITLAAWLGRRTRKLRAKIPHDRNHAAITRFDR